MSIEVVLEFRAKQGKRDELRDALEALVQDHGSGLEGYLGSTRYEVVDEPDLLVEIATWQSVETRAKHLEEAKASGAFAPVFDLLDGPPKATILREFAASAPK